MVEKCEENFTHAIPSASSTTQHQGCQTKISEKSQTVLKRGQKKAKPNILSQEKSQTLFVALLFLCHNKTYL